MSKPSGETIEEIRDDSSGAGHGNVVAAARGARPRLRNAGVVVALAIALTSVAQYFAPIFDHQNANLLGLACLSVATVYLLFCLHRLARWSGFRWAVPALTLVSIMMLLVGFRFEGFSGEMLPLFRWRFAAEVERELKSVTADFDYAEAIASKRAVANAGVSSTKTKGDSPLIVQDFQSPQFLGPQRNAVYPERGFAIPKSVSELEVAWEHGIGEGWSSFAVAGDQAITLEQRGNEECLSCYRLEDGELLWILKHSGRHENPLGGIGPRSTPTIVGDRVYATTATGFLWCVERLTGTVVWTRDLLELAGWNQSAFETAAPWGYACSPLLVDGLCVLSLGGPPGGPASHSLAALQADTGTLQWTSGDDQLSYASPILTTLAGERQIVSVNEKTVTGHQISDGQLLWRFQWPGSTNTGANCSSAVTVGSDQILVGKGYGGGSALVRVSQDESGWKASDVWRSGRALKTKFNHICVDGNVGYAISNGSLQAVSLIDATEYWTQPRRVRSGQGQVILVDDVLIVQDEEGDVVFVDAITDDYNELLRVPALESKTWNIPAVAGRYLLVRNDRQVICFKLPEKPLGT